MTLLHLRPGGGESFSGGGGHDGGGSGGGGAIFELIFYLIQLIFYYPTIAIPLLIAAIAYFAWSAHQRHQNRDWDSGPPATLEAALELDELRARDPDFSQVVFEDFAFRLFAAAQRARPDQLAGVAPYVSQAARDELAAREPANAKIEQVIVGAQRVVRFEIDDATDGRVRVGVEYEANVATAGHTYYSVETWLYARDAQRRSKPPGAARDFPCPNCGAPWQASATGTQTCASCGQVVDNGRFDWIVEHISLASLDERAPTLTAAVPERGTDLPTYRQADLARRLAALSADDPAFAEPQVIARLRMIYDELNRTWAVNELAPVRGLVSDGLYDYLTYWTSAYARQGLRNVLADMRITKTAIAKLERDRWYDALTIRLWGTGKDYVIRSDTGRVVRGSMHLERAYSEYWTLIRSAARKGPAKTDATCANCGAPLKVGMSGACDHCGAHVTGGEFDWVVSKIEQDDTYRG
jgi:uncharacterized Zn finger protein (UPF0148 family)